MLNRYQIMLNNWLSDYLKIIAKKYKSNLSEMVRISLCLSIGRLISQYCKCDFNFNEKKLLEMMKKFPPSKQEAKARKALINNLYFECRKIIDCHLEKLKKK